MKVQPKLFRMSNENNNSSEQGGQNSGNGTQSGSNGTQGGGTDPVIKPAGNQKDSTI